MRGTRRTAQVLTVLSAAVVAASAPGCQTSPLRQARAEPSLTSPVEPGSTVVEAPPQTAPKWSFVDRHPLFSKPRDLYESSGNNYIVKTAAATVIGIPAGLFGEIKQIVVGTPTDARY
jgi:hypothetical protein